MPKVYRFRKYAPTHDDYVMSSRMATKKKIKELGAEIIPDTETKVDDEALTDGWTPKNFVPRKT